MASKYVYRRHLPADYVRLLTLVSDGENFHGSLEEFRRDNLPYFNALSWCWSSGGEQQTTSFTCDGQSFTVSQHLYNLLSHLNPKNSHSSGRIWIDSICINQEDIEEKNIHVGHMQAIGRLCDRDWFYRTWVIQEIALARNAELLCGTQRLGWDDFVNLIRGISGAGLASICRGPRSTGITRPDGFGVLMDLAWTRTMVQKDDMSMSYLLHAVRLKEVTKPVDKVYGILGIVGEDVRSAIKVDYVENDQQYWKAYVELAEQILTADDPGFWLLCMASSRERPEELPSWCPNLNCLTANYLDFGSQKWQAGIGDETAREGGIRLIEGSFNIQIPGFRIDVVDEVVYIGGPYSAAVGQEDRGSDGNTTTFLEKDTLCLALTQRCFGHVNDALDAYARTLIEGDAVCVFYQAGPVFILRHEQGSGVWKLIGDAYLHGCMDLDSMPEAGRGSDTTFIIS